ncbi:MAG: HAD hydrolase family protein [Alistipes sp.]|jgi:3-deoxy-D-manno-octulosonate 8-phosphate phosphatase (KDO 8-P phosphatase)|nr:HAD hydrolase family protein [Alistipes sp.]MBR0339014.1 HAD hydrolase family protein [Alistipes sp.]
MRKDKNFKELLADVEAIVFDVDGVMTDGGIMPLSDGDFIRKYNAKDGYALAYAVKQGFKIGVISGGFGKNLESRLNRLHIEHKYLNCMDKIAAIDDFVTKTGVSRENVIYMGDDIPDLEVLRYVGIPVAPADACAEVLEEVIYVSERNGGEGAVRDIIEQVLRVKGIWALDSKGVISDK